MAINKIALENFTVFGSTQIEFCNGLNILIGENGTGKTHILKAIYGFCSGIRLGAANIESAFNDPSLFPNSVSLANFASLCTNKISYELIKLFHMPNDSMNCSTQFIEIDAPSSSFS